MKKIRLDTYLAANGISQSRERAKREILAGWVRVNGETVTDPSAAITGDETITAERPGGQFASRGGDKLRHALATFGIDLGDRVAADLGASTGGFTDCMLKSGASKVYAVDVGYGQLDYALRSDPRVVVMERRHVNSLTPADFREAVDFVAADLSFISLLKVADTIIRLFPGAEGVFLVKPQFEADPGEHKKGVVRKPEDHGRILTRVLLGMDEKKIEVMNLAFSPLKGPKGNIEFLAHVSIPGGGDARHGTRDFAGIIDRLVESAHEALDKKK